MVRRESNPKEPSIGAYGIIDALPTGWHFGVRNYDDIIDEDNVTSPEMIEKSIKRWELSLSLGSDRICPRYGEANIVRYVGTRYKKNDTWDHIEKVGAAEPRIFPGTVDGTRDGKPVYFTNALMEDKKKTMGRYTFACQILMDPKADALQSFKEEWIREWEPQVWGWTDLNVYMLVDPASKKKKRNDFTDIKVIGLAPDQTYKWIDGVTDRLSLTERAKAVMDFQRKYRPLKVGYEEYGLQADIEHIEDLQTRTQYHFTITPLGGKLSKDDKIGKLIPIFEYSRMWIPAKCLFIDHEGFTQDATQIFKNQYDVWPVSGGFDDSLDNMSRILDKDFGAVFPEPEDEFPTRRQNLKQAEREYDPFAAQEQERTNSYAEQQQHEANVYRPYGE